MDVHAVSNTTTEAQAPVNRIQWPRWFSNTPKVQDAQVEHTRRTEVTFNTLPSDQSLNVNFSKSGSSGVGSVQILLTLAVTRSDVVHVVLTERCGMFEPLWRVCEGR